MSADDDRPTPGKVTPGEATPDEATPDEATDGGLDQGALEADARVAVRADLEAGLSTLFPPDPARGRERSLVADTGPRYGDLDADVPIEQAPTFSHETGGHAVAWRYHGVDAVGVCGLAPTGRAIVIRGMTVVDPRTQTFRRYIDWLDAYAQLGLTMSCRSVIAPPPARPRA